ncbi:MAG: lytic transglycosylase domain-containing protein, partial [Holosporales bacterium]|nr:lytic transglycosylase domain-containing protein [Holosporales bacterium]
KEKKKESDREDCSPNLIEKAELQHGIPKGLLLSVAMVESGCSPYSVNTSRRSIKFDSKENAVSFISGEIQRGNQNMSIGCMQLHYKTHGRNFVSVAEMLDSKKNALYAARLLRSLRDRYGTWEKAVKAYHSGRARAGAAYYRKVMRRYGGDKTVLAS